MTTLSQIELIEAICKHLRQKGVKTFATRQYNAIINAADSILEEIKREPVMASKNIGLTRWLVSDDTGMSSKFMASVLSNLHIGKLEYPHDADDFGRCIRLLDAVPEFRERLDIMREHGIEWANLLDCWTEAEYSYRSNDYKTCNKLVSDAAHPLTGT